MLHGKLPSNKTMMLYNIKGHFNLETSLNLRLTFRWSASLTPRLFWDINWTGADAISVNQRTESSLHTSIPQSCDHDRQLQF